MTALRCSRRGSRLNLRVLPAQRSEEETAQLLQEATQRGRALAWQQARALSAQSSPWDLEYFKAQLGEPECLLGGAEALAERCASLADGQTIELPAAPQTLQLRSLRQALCRCGLTPGFSPMQAWADRFHWAAATALAVVMLLVYLLRFTRQPNALPAMGAPLVAVHGEWSNRTRHLLSQIGPELTPAAILLLGRPQTDLNTLRQTWASHLSGELPSLVVPASAAAAWLALPQLWALLRQGLDKVAAAPFRPPLREHSAIVFRILLGGVMARWWQDHATPGGTVLLGHTGTGDTDQLERAIQRKGGRTVHVVHGLCTGPNFVGFSSKAIFHCAFDAQRYASLHHYGCCSAPSAAMPPVQRGATGLLLLTNYAHPMNPGYRERGLADELQVLREVAHLAGELGAPAQPLHWKPHPAVQRISPDDQTRLRAEASFLGYVEVTDQGSTLQTACSALWVLTTPSTVAVDLLSAGCLPFVLDKQSSASDDAIGKMPTCFASIEELRANLEPLQSTAAHADMYETVWKCLGPASALTASELTSPNAHP